MMIIDDIYQVSASSENIRVESQNFGCYKRKTNVITLQTTIFENTPSSTSIQRAVKKSQNHLLEMIVTQKPDLIELIFANNLSVLGQGYSYSFKLMYTIVKTQCLLL
jgi:hypothetical protein